MATTILDIENAFMDAEAEIAEWEQEFQAEFYGPLLRVQKARTLRGMDDFNQAAFRESDPEEFERLAKGMRRLPSYQVAGG
jgi:hypothetical protein